MKNDIASMNDLAARISELEAAEFAQMAALKSQANKVLDDFKPSSILKNAFSSITSSKVVRNGAIDTSLGFGAGWLVKKIFQANSTNIFRKLAGSVLQNIATGIFTRKMPAIRQKISNLQ